MNKKLGDLRFFEEKIGRFWIFEEKNSGIWVMDEKFRDFRTFKNWGQIGLTPRSRKKLGVEKIF